MSEKCYKCQQLDSASTFCDGHGCDISELSKEEIEGCSLYQKPYEDLEAEIEELKKENKRLDEEVIYELKEKLFCYGSASKGVMRALKEACSWIEQTQDDGSKMDEDYFLERQRITRIREFSLAELEELCSEFVDKEADNTHLWACEFVEWLKNGKKIERSWWPAQTTKRHY